MSAGELPTGPAPEQREKRHVVTRVWSAIWVAIVGLLAIRRGILLSLTVSSGFIFLDAYFQENHESRARAVEWVRVNWQEPIDQITPSGISSHFERIMNECSFGAFETRPPLVGCKERRIISTGPVTRVPDEFPTPSLIPVPTPGPFSLVRPSPAPSPGILEEFGASRERLPGLSERLAPAIPISLGTGREPDGTPGAQYVPAIKAWLATPLVLVTVVGTIVSSGWAGIIVFVPSLVLSTLLLGLMLRHTTDPRVLLFIAVILQVYLAGIGLIAVGLKSIILLVVGSIQWTLQSVILINILIQAADKILADREALTLQARIVDLERSINTPRS
jgi:hypothetical protein